MLSNVRISSGIEEEVNKDGTKWSNRSYEETGEKEKKGGRLNFNAEKGSCR
jgi:hypothetical protein